MATEVGALRVKLAMDAGEFSSGAKQAGNMVASLENQILGFATSWQGALTGAILATTAFAFNAKDRFAKAIDDISQIGKTAQKIGIAVEALSQFQYAAERSGVSSDVFANSIKKLSVNLQDSLKGGSSEATTALKNMGVSVIDTNGKLKSTTDIILAISDKFAGYKDSANKTAIAVALFGRAGTEMIPFLNKGSDGIEKLTEKADKLGMTVNSQTVAAVKTLRGEVRDVTDGINGFYRKLVVDLSPSLLEASKAVVDLNINLGLTSGATKVADASVGIFTETLKGANFIILQVSRGYKDLLLVTNAFGQTMTSVKNIQSYTTEIKNWAASLESSKGKLLDSAAASKSWSTTLQDSAEQVQEKMDAPSLAKSKLGEILETTTKQVAALQALQSRTSGKPLLSLDATVNESLDEYNKKLKVTQALMTAVKGDPKFNTDIGAAIALEQYNKALAYGKQITEEYATPIEKAAKAQAQLNDALRIGAINQKTFAKASQENSAFSQQALEGLAGATTNFLSKAFSEQKEAAIAIALINTAVGVTKALSGFLPPVSFIMAGLQAAAGIAEVAKIRSMTSAGGGGGGGGGGTVSGASGAATAVAAQTAAPPAASTLLVQGISPGQMFTGDVVRDLASRLLDFQKDGGKVVLA